MTHKIFISHSSVQKPYVEDLLNVLGYDYAFVDKYAFESGEDLWEEIRSAIDKCDFFVYLISKEALESKWVRSELSYVREKIDEGKITFFPFIIDSSIDVTDQRIKRWIINSYITDSFIHPRTLARLLKKKIRRSIWEQYPSIKAQSHLFIGREKELYDLSEAFYNDCDICKLSIIVSGLSHLGRKRLLREFISAKVFPSIDPFDLIEIKLNDRDSIQDFAIQLNDIVEEYLYDDLLDHMKDKVGALDTTVGLLNKLHSLKEYIVIDDNKCIVRGDGLLTEWFVDIIKNKKLVPHLHLNLASRFTPRPDLNEIFPCIVTLQIHPLQSVAMKMLFNAYALNKEIDTESLDVNSYINEFAGYPEQVLLTVDTLAHGNIGFVGRKVEELKSRFDNNFQTIISDLQKDDRYFQVLILLSHFEFISYDYLCRICGEDISDVLEMFHYNSLTESFGMGKQYISLNPAVVDYIKRLEFKLDGIYKQKLSQATREVLENKGDADIDISYRLHAVKELLRSGCRASEPYLIPSFVLKVITDEYYAKHDKNVISLADRILKGYNRNSYQDVIRNIIYWLCCSLCRTKDHRFFKEVKYFDENSYSYSFLNGFYYRHSKRYSKAKEFYEEALRRTGKYDADSYISKAEHEMVIVCMALGKYGEALDLAKHSYERNSANTYHIESYFRCLVRSPHPSKDILKLLMEEMKNSFDTHREIISKSMSAEYKYYIEGDFTGSVSILKQAILTNSGTYRNYPLRSLKDVCMRRNALPIYNSILKSIRDDFKEEPNFDIDI